MVESGLLGGSRLGVGMRMFFDRVAVGFVVHRGACLVAAAGVMDATAP
jgi:hypothetical protein